MFNLFVCLAVSLIALLVFAFLIWVSREGFFLRSVWFQSILILGLALSHSSSLTH
jgi:hypothetical protein